MLIIGDSTGGLRRHSLLSPVEKLVASGVAPPDPHKVLHLCNNNHAVPHPSLYVSSKIASDVKNCPIVIFQVIGDIR